MKHRQNLFIRLWDDEIYQSSMRVDSPFCLSNYKICQKETNDRINSSSISNVDSLLSFAKSIQCNRRLTNRKISRITRPKWSSTQSMIATCIIISPKVNRRINPRRMVFIWIQMIRISILDWNNDYGNRDRNYLIKVFPSVKRFESPRRRSMYLIKLTRTNLFVRWRFIHSI